MAEQNLHVGVWVSPRSVRKGVGPGMQEYASSAFKARCLPEFKCALLVRPEVEADIAEAEAWYEERQEGLGKEFRRAVRDAVRELPINPLIYRLRHPRLGVRWRYPRRFPDRITHRVKGDPIVVYAVPHAKQHDRY